MALALSNNPAGPEFLTESQRSVFITQGGLRGLTSRLALQRYGGGTLKGAI
ncbi:hypothetical protein OG470_06130 [Micromonospora sp. NBC_00389]|uniref:hypothetical protein n=1 Tax=Micromonospora sp. NBC_00389 TaxID=2903586 RepID=UPI002E22887A